MVRGGQIACHPGPGNTTARGLGRPAAGSPFLLCQWFKNLVHFSICACHPCAGAMLIFSVSFQFYLSLFFNTARRGPRSVGPPPREFAHWGCEDRIGAVGQTPTESPAFQPQHPNTRTHNVPRRLRLGPPYDLAWSSLSLSLLFSFFGTQGSIKTQRLL